MAAWRYLAVDRTGVLTRGIMEAPSEAALVEHLRRQGSIPVRAEPAPSGGRLAGLLRIEIGLRPRGALRRQELAEVTRELAVMLGAGTDLDRALRFLVETAPNARVRASVARLREAVRGGSPLTAAMAQQPESFPRLYIGMLRAGEAGGTLAATLDRLALLLERERALAASIRAAMVYPAILAVAAIGSIALLLTQVLPQFVPLFEQSGAELPLPTQVLIAAGDAMARDGPFALLALAGLILVARLALQHRRPRLLFDRLLLRLPVAGKLAREVMAARFGRTLGTLLLNGVPLVAALGVVQDALGNLAGAEAVGHAARGAKGGAGLAGPLGETGLFPPRTVLLLRLGEEAAQLGPMALRAAEIHEEQVRLAVQRLVGLLVPAVTIVMGAAVAGIVASLLLAVLSLNDLAG